MMRNVSHWTLGGRRRRPAGDSARCGSQLSHNLKLFPNARESSSREERKGERCPDADVNPRAKNARKEQEKKKRKRERGRSNRTGCHKHPHNDLYDERFEILSSFIFPPLFLSPRPRCRTYILSRHTVLSPPSYIYYTKVYVSLSLARSILRILVLCTCFVSSHYFSSSSLSSIDHDVYLALFLVPAFFWIAGEFSPCIFQWKSTWRTRRAQLESLY